jgi:hypothetical protein
MTTVFSVTATALATLGVPYAENTFRGDLPDVYLVYQLISSPADQHADDEETLRSFRIQVSGYSKTGLAALPNIDSAMKAAGFMKATMRELPFDPDTGHFGLTQDYILEMTS